MRYTHFKGGIYELVGHATHSETLERLVIYSDEDGDLWARPYEMFYGSVEVDGETVRRFSPETSQKMRFNNFAFVNHEVKHRLYDPTGPEHGRTIIPKKDGRYIQTNEIIISDSEGPDERRYIYKGDHDLDGAKRMERVSQEVQQ